MLKKRMITLLMSVAMLFTFMPAMAFAEAEESSEQQANESSMVKAEGVTAEESIGSKDALEAVDDEDVKPTSIKFIPASDFEFKTTEGRTELDLVHNGNSFVVGYSDGNYKTFKPVEYEVNDGDNGSFYTVGWFLDGETGKESFTFGTEINDGADSEFKSGENKVRFTCGDDPIVYTDYFTVTAEVKPVALDFIPADGVTFWGYETANILDSGAFFTLGNKFIVTYSDNTTKTFTYRNVDYELNGNTISENGYYENGVEINADNVAALFQRFGDYIPAGVLKRGDNEIRFQLQYDGGTVYTTKTYNAIGKPYAVSMSFSPNTVDAEITPYGDDIFVDVPGSYFTIQFSDGSTKIFRYGAIPIPGKEDTHYGFACDGEELMWEIDETKLQEGPNTRTLYVYGLRPIDNTSDSAVLKYNVTVNAAKPSTPPARHTKHSLVKVAATKATCQASGIKAHYKCSECGELFTDKNGKKATSFKKLTVKKTKHVFKKKNLTNEYLKSAASCTKPAVYYYSCKICGQKGKKTFKSGKALGHDFVAGNITKATAKKDGKKASKCSRCGKTNKGVKIPKTSKVFSLNKKSVRYTGGGKEKDAINVRIKAGKFPLGSQEFFVVYGEPVYDKNGKGSGTVTVNFKPECKYYSGTLKLTYKITKVPKK